jgi:hypothetical protein
MSTSKTLLIVLCSAWLGSCGRTELPAEDVAKSAMMFDDPRYDEVSVHPGPPEKGDKERCGSQYKHAARYANACPRGSQCAVMQQGIVCYGDSVTEPSKNMVNGVDADASGSRWARCTMVAFGLLLILAIFIFVGLKVLAYVVAGLLIAAMLAKLLH